MTSVDAIWASLEHRLPAALSLRRELHRHPDLSGAESGTRDRVLAALPTPDARTDVAGTGSVLRFGPPGPNVAIRGEMDALPVQEGTSVAWASERPGAMHACGHDVHLAAVTAVIGALHDTYYPAPLLLVLQPREETYPSGARDIAETGVLERAECAAMLGVHIQPALPAGVVACTPGGVNASSDEFCIVVTGTSGHAAYPHHTRDPLLTMSEIVVALQSIVSRSVDPMFSAVVGVSSFAAGAAANVIPGLATVTGTLRALHPPTRTFLRTRVVEVAENIAQAHGCSAKVKFTLGEPVLHNDPALTAAITAQLSIRRVTIIEDLRSLGADDFAFFSERIPSTMLFVGSDSMEPLHSPTFLPTDTDVSRVAATYLSGYLAAAALIEAARGPLAQLGNHHDGGVVTNAPTA